MSGSQISGKQILDGSIARSELCTTIPEQSVIAKIIAGAGISIESTGVDEGTGDVTISVEQSSNSSVEYITNNIIMQTAGVVELASTLPNQPLYALDTNIYQSAVFIVQGADSVSGAYHTTNISVITDGLTVLQTEYGSINVGGIVGSYSTILVDNILTLQVTPNTLHPTVFKIAVTLIKK